VVAKEGKMRTKFLVCVISFFLLLILNTQVSAAWENDSTGEQVVAGYDILRAKAEAYPIVFDQIPENITFSLEMNSGSNLPGMVIFEIDVDNDTDTGGSSGLANALNACGSGSKIKSATPGFDLYIMLILRDQGDDAATAWCNGCMGPPTDQCVTRGGECSGCSGGGTYYQQGDSCIEGPDCYVLGDSSACNEGTCYALEQLCADAEEACDTGRLRGEWATGHYSSGGDDMDVYWGRIDMPLPKETDTDDNDSYTLPWSRIVQATYDALVAEGVDPSEIFDIEAAKDISNYGFQISTWYDPDYATTQNDFIDEIGICWEVSDVVPDTGMAAAQEGTTSSTTTTVPDLAAWEHDSTGEHVVAEYDILRAKAEAYPIVVDQIPENITFSLDMNSGSNLPGIVVFEVDVDNDTDTGSSSGLANALNACGSGSKIKSATPGFDLYIMLMLRDQGDDADTARCSGCTGPQSQTCYERGAGCTNCGGDTCYQQGTSCTPGGPGCYLLGDYCTCDQLDCYTLDQICEAEEDCDTGKLRGEWATGQSPGGDDMDIYWGRIDMPLPKETDTDNSDSYTLPWARIVQATYDAMVAEGVDPSEIFDIEAAKNPSNYGFQVSTWADPNFETTEDDFLDKIVPCWEVSDVVPDTGMATIKSALSLQFDVDQDEKPDGPVELIL
jgi:hypothetical protein